MARQIAHLLCSAYVSWALLLPGCTSAPPQQPTQAASAQTPAAWVPPVSTGNEIALRAISLLGAKYSYGGAGPDAFDCSGLVRFVHDQLGIAVPRTAAEQYAAAKRVSIDGLEPGDLLFFRTRGRGISHVAIYTGGGRFVHAPQTGRPVEFRTLEDQYYRPRLAGAGRLF